MVRFAWSALTNPDHRSAFDGTWFLHAEHRAASRGGLWFAWAKHAGTREIRRAGAHRTPEAAQEAVEAIV